MTRELDLILTHEHTDFDALASLLGAALLYPHAVAVLPRLLNRNVAEFVTLYRSWLPFARAGELPKERIASIVLVDTRALNAPRALSPECAVTVIDHHFSPEDADSAPDSTSSALSGARPRGQRTAPATWTMHVEAVGANTTLLVERIMHQHMALNSIQATLLALGIHEDTNSLTYGGTTPRDGAALAWLMETPDGVNLDLLNRFLNHPLSDDQRQLLRQLIEASEIVDVDGLNCVIAIATTASPTEEISTVTARLRDFHEPDAVFVLVAMQGMVQVVARSTTNDVDVGAIMRILGGGGHIRAAAASVHGMSTVEIATVIREHLARQARAVVTVGEIMTEGRPQTLLPNMRIEDASLLMRRYGYEGFPVVATDGKSRAASGVKEENASSTVVEFPGVEFPGVESPGVEILGVLTRREADRAMDHGLGNEKVSRFMRAGSITVLPGDSLNTLRKRMSDSGWGQIPVVDAAGALVGIVTRTDLIRTWDEVPSEPALTEQEVERLTSALTPAQNRLLRLIGTLADEMGAMVYVVGGFVRDLYLGKVASDNINAGSFDIDLVIEGDAIALAQRVQHRYGGRVVPHTQFGTAKWLIGDRASPLKRERIAADLSLEIETLELPEHLDFVTARTEFYTEPSALPTVERSSIRLDLLRRDFTINTLALSLAPASWGKVLDYFGGVADIDHRVIRVMHSLSFVDDPTRMLRAVRYERRFGFEIEPRTLELLGDALPLLDRVSPARLRHELERILQEHEPETILLRLDHLGILRSIHGNLRASDWVVARFRALRTALELPADDPVAAALRLEPLERLYWAVLVYQLDDVDIQALNERLLLRRETRRIVEALQALHQEEYLLADSGLTASQVTEVLQKQPEPAVALFALLAAESQVRVHVERYLGEWRSVRPTLTGNDLQKLGIARGPMYRDILWAIHAALLDGRAHTRADEEIIARSYLAARLSGSGDADDSVR